MRNLSIILGEMLLSSLMGFFGTSYRDEYRIKAERIQETSLEINIVVAQHTHFPLLIQSDVGI